MQSCAELWRCCSVNTLFVNIIRNQSTKKNALDLKKVVKTNYNFAMENKLPKIPSSFGPLTNLPDYRFKDGRTVPYNAGQMRRIDEQKKFLETIKHLVEEIDDAKLFHQLELQTAEEKRQFILDRKLKAKGNKLCVDFNHPEPGEKLKKKLEGLRIEEKN